MDRAAQRALEKYPKRKDGQTRGYVCDDDDIRRIYSQGYRKAEKDLTLTADEIRLIFNKVRIKQSMYNATEGCYQEVADWFNEQRRRNESK